MYVATGGPNVKWGGTDFKWGGRAPLAPPLATALAGTRGNGVPTLFHVLHQNEFEAVLK